MDHSPQIKAQVSFYGSSDQTSSITETGLRFVRANSKSKSEDLGPFGECALSLVGTIGTRDGRNSVFLHFRLLEPNCIRLVRSVPIEWPEDAQESWLMRTEPPKIEHPRWMQNYRASANLHTAKFIWVGLADRSGKQIGLDDEGFALGNHSTPKNWMPAGEYYVTITTQQSTPIPFHVQLVVGNPLVQVETTQITKAKSGNCGSTPGPDSGPGPGPTPDCTGDDDCEGDQVCSGGKCVDPTPTPKECSSNDDCDDGFFCGDDFTCIQECDGPGDCPEGKVCSNGGCVDPPSGVFNRVLHPDTTDFHRPLILKAMTVVEKYVQLHPGVTQSAQHNQWSTGDRGTAIAWAGPTEVDLLRNTDGTPAGVNTKTFQLNVNPIFNETYSENQWVAIWVHELLHALGIIYWRIPQVSSHMGHSSNSWASGYLTTSEFSNAVAGYRAHTSKADSEIAPLNADNGAHWNYEDKTFSAYPGVTFPGTREVMTPTARSGLKLTDLSLGALEDYGYRVTKVGGEGVDPFGLDDLPEEFVCGVQTEDLSAVKCRVRWV